MEAGHRAQQIDPLALQRPDRRHDLHGRGQRVSGPGDRGPLLRAARRGDGIQSRQRHRHAAPRRSTACFSWGCPAIRSSGASTNCSPQWGGTFVNSTYLWFAPVAPTSASSTTCPDPLSSLAEGVLVSVRDAMDTMFHQNEVLVDMVRDFSADGVIYHPIKSCRTVSTGLADGRRFLTGRTASPACSSSRT